MKNLVITASAAATLLMGSLSAFAAEPIVGTWKRENGTLIKFAGSGGDNFCGKVLTGEYKGKSIGCMAGTGGNYTGSINVLDEGKTYSGKAKAIGSAKLKLSGCVLGGIICKSETMNRQ